MDSQCLIVVGTMHLADDCMSINVTQVSLASLHIFNSVSCNTFVYAFHMIFY